LVEVLASLFNARAATEDDRCAWGMRNSISGTSFIHETLNTPENINTGDNFNWIHKRVVKLTNQELIEPSPANCNR